jgi:hypothetical protein
MSPLVHGAFSPAANKASEEQSVAGRIDKFKRSEPKGHDFRDQCMEEFATLIMEGTIQLTPVCVETVEEKQCTSAQKRSLASAFCAGPYVQRILKLFIKAEAYSDPKDPRSISTYNDVDKLTMAVRVGLVDPLEDVQMVWSWYEPNTNCNSSGGNLLYSKRVCKYI